MYLTIIIALAYIGAGFFGGLLLYKVLSLLGRVGELMLLVFPGIFVGAGINVFVQGPPEYYIIGSISIGISIGMCFYLWVILP